MLNMLKSSGAVSGTVSVEIEETMATSEVHLDSCAAASFSSCFGCADSGRSGLRDVIWTLEFLLGPVGGGPLRPESMLQGSTGVFVLLMVTACLQTLLLAQQASERASSRFLLRSPKLIFRPVCLSQAGNINAGQLHFQLFYIWMNSKEYCKSSLG